MSELDDYIYERVLPCLAGTITTVAGTGTPGASGDGGAATLAEIGYPVGVAAMPDGGYLIAGQYGEVVRACQRRRHDHDGRRHRYARLLGRRVARDARSPRLCTRGHPHAGRRALDRRSGQRGRAPSVA